MEKKFLAIPVLLAVAILLAGCTDIIGSSNNLRVTVVDDSGSVLEGAQVNVYTNYTFSEYLGNGLKWASLSGTLSAGKLTDSTGTVAFNLPSARYAVNAYKEGYYYNGDEVILTSDKSITIVLARIETDTLNELLDNQNYTVQQTFAQVPHQRAVWNFSPEIRKFDDTGADDLQYILAQYNSTVYLCSIGDGRLTYSTQTINGEPDCSSTMELIDGMTEGGGGTIHVRTNSVGLYQLEFERQ